jgi:hypothetical protein
MSCGKREWVGFGIEIEIGRDSEGIGFREERR